MSERREYAVFTNDVRAWVLQLHRLGLVPLPTWGQGKAQPGTHFRELADKPPSIQDVAAADYSGGLAILTGNAAPHGGYVVGVDIDAGDAVGAALTDIPQSALEHSLYVERGTGPGKWHLWTVTADRLEGKLNIVSNISGARVLLAEVMGRGATHIRSWPTEPPDKPQGYTRHYVAPAALAPQATVSDLVASLLALFERLGVSCEIERRAPHSGRPAGPRTQDDPVLLTALVDKLEELGLRPKSSSSGWWGCRCPFHGGSGYTSMYFHLEIGRWGCFGCLEDGWLDELGKRLGMDWPGRDHRPVASSTARATTEAAPMDEDAWGSILGDAPSATGQDDPGSPWPRRGPRTPADLRELTGRDLIAARNGEWYDILRMSFRGRGQGTDSGTLQNPDALGTRSCTLAGAPINAVDRRNCVPDEHLEELLAFVEANDHNRGGHDSKVVQQYRRCGLWARLHCRDHGFQEKHAKTHFTCKLGVCPYCPTRATSRIRLVHLAEPPEGGGFRSLWVTFPVRPTAAVPGWWDTYGAVIKTTNRLVQRIGNRKGWRGKLLNRAISFKLARPVSDVTFKLLLREDRAGEADGLRDEIVRVLGGVVIGDKSYSQPETAIMQAMEDSSLHLHGIEDPTDDNLFDEWWSATKRRALTEPLGELRKAIGDCEDGDKHLRCDVVKDSGEVCGLLLYLRPWVDEAGDSGSWISWHTGQRRDGGPAPPREPAPALAQPIAPARGMFDSAPAGPGF